MDNHEFIWRHLGNDYNLGTAFMAIVVDNDLKAAEEALFRALQNPESCGRSNAHPSTEVMDALGVGRDIRLALVILQMAQASTSASRHDCRAYLNNALRKVQEVRG